jgi:hypothetical protein
MRKSALLLAVLLAASVSTNAYAKHRHHHHHRHHAQWAAAGYTDMTGLALLGTLSLFAPTPITIWATSAADEAAAHALRHRH